MPKYGNSSPGPPKNWNFWFISYKQTHLNNTLLTSPQPLSSGNCKTRYDYFRILAILEKSASYGSPWKLSFASRYIGLHGVVHQPNGIPWWEDTHDFHWHTMLPQNCRKLLTASVFSSFSVSWSYVRSIFQPWCSWRTSKYASSQEAIFLLGSSA